MGRVGVGRVTDRKTLPASRQIIALRRRRRHTKMAREGGDDESTGGVNASSFAPLSAFQF